MDLGSMHVMISFLRKTLKARFTRTHLLVIKSDFILLEFGKPDLLIPSYLTKFWDIVLSCKCGSADEKISAMDRPGLKDTDDHMLKKRVK